MNKKDITFNCSVLSSIGAAIRKVMEICEDPNTEDEDKIYEEIAKARIKHLRRSLDMSLDAITKRHIGGEDVRDN